MYNDILLDAVNEIFTCLRSKHSHNTNCVLVTILKIRLDK